MVDKYEGIFGKFMRDEWDDKVRLPEFSRYRTLDELINEIRGIRGHLQSIDYDILMVENSLLTLKIIEEGPK